MLTVRSLDVADAGAVAELLGRQSAEYIQYFHPFAFDESTIQHLLSQRRRDCWIGVWWTDRLAGMFMLRGFDEGYAIPTYGVAIDAQASGKGLGRLTLQLAKSMCRLMGVERIMLKVHPSNEVARTLYESEGFAQAGIEAGSGQLIYHLQL